MGDMRREISSCFFGGYNKRNADAYIGELQAMIEELQEDLESAQKLTEKQAEKLTEAEVCYRTLWERSIDQEKTLEQLKNEIETNKNLIDDQKETLRAKEEIIRNQKERADELKSQLEQKELTIQENQDLIAQLEDRAEKQQWLYEEFFKNKERVPVSKLEQYIHESMRKRMERKRQRSMVR